MTTERRKATVEYREEVHTTAEFLLREHGDDYDAAAEFAEMQAEKAASWYGSDSRTGRFRRDVASLLTRRAETVNCPQPR